MIDTVKFFERKYVLIKEMIKIDKIDRRYSHFDKFANFNEVIRLNIQS